MSEFMDMGSVNYRLATFDKLHGASVYDEGWIRFEDGACREADPMGVMMDPPAHPFDLAKRKARYHKVVFERAMRAFDNAKQNLRDIAGMNLNSPVCGPAPAIEDAIGNLKALQAVALAAKEKHDKALAGVEAARPDRDRVNELMNQQNQERNRNLLNALEKIEL